MQILRLNKCPLRLTLLFVLLSSLNVFGQDQDRGQVRFSVFPPVGNTILRIDETVVIDTVIKAYIEMDTGYHKIEIWGDKYLTVDTFVYVIPDSIVTFKKVMNYSEIYEDHCDKLWQYKAYQYRVNVPRYISFGSFISGIALYSTTLNYEKEIERLRNEYYIAGPTQLYIDKVKEQLDKHQANILIKRYISIGFIGAGVVFQAVSIKRNQIFNKKYIEKPEYFPGEPFDYSLSLHSGYDGIGVKLNF